MLQDVSVTGMCGPELLSAGRGDDENPQGGVGRDKDENPRPGAGRGKKVAKSSDPKIQQKCVNC